MDNNTITVTLLPEEKTELETRWEKAGIGDDFIFSCVMRNPELFLKLMQRIFPELNLTRVAKHSPQMTFLAPAGSKSVRYDVYSEINGRSFDVEMQMESRGNEPRRTRYYQCLMDEQVLHTGEDYAQLPDSYIVMISPHDLFHKGRHIYRFRNFEERDRDLALEDGTVKVFLNSRGTADDILPDLKNFLDLVNGKEPADDFCLQIDKAVQAAKLDAETRRNFMDFEYTRRLDRIDSEKKGRREERLENYASLVRDGLLPLATAMERSKLSEAEIEQWISRHPS